MTTAWLRSAPRKLIDAYEAEKIGVCRDILMRLLSDSRMESVWTKLAKCKPDSTCWIAVWGHIVSAKAKSNTAADTSKPGKHTKFRQTRGDESEQYKKLARKFADLAKEIENGPLALPLLEYLPVDVWKALGVKNPKDMHWPEREAVVPQMQGIWPRAPELLCGIASHASRLADDAMTRPRPDDRKSGDMAARTFIWHLAPNIVFQFGKPLHTEVGKIAAVVLGLTAPEIYESKVVRSILAQKGKRVAKAV